MRKFFARAATLTRKIAEWLVPVFTVIKLLIEIAGIVFTKQLEAISTAFVQRVLPWFGIAIARDSRAWTVTEGLVGFATLGLLYLLFSQAIEDRAALSKPYYSTVAIRLIYATYRY